MDEEAKAGAAGAPARVEQGGAPEVEQSFFQQMRALVQENVARKSLETQTPGAVPTGEQIAAEVARLEAATPKTSEPGVENTQPWQWTQQAVEQFSTSLATMKSGPMTDIWLPTHLNEGQDTK